MIPPDYAAMQSPTTPHSEQKESSIHTGWLEVLGLAPGGENPRRTLNIHAYLGLLMGTHLTLPGVKYAHWAYPRRSEVGGRENTSLPFTRTSCWGR